jgi:hypothetical protein
MLVPRPSISTTDIENTLNKAIDWFHYQDNCWILYTVADAEIWYSRLEHLAKPEGAFLISKLDMSDVQGYFAQDFWDWLEKIQGKAKTKVP